MKERIKTVSALAVALFVGVGAVSLGAAQTPQTALAAEDYYAPITATKGEELLGQLHDLITTTHTYYASYENCRDYAKTTDPALNGEDGIVEFYTHETITTYIGSSNAAGTWNREHVWPQSLSKESGGRQLWGKEGGGSDLHHIRPSEKEMNGQRGNDRFGEVTNGGEVYSKKTDGSNSLLGGHHAGGVFEPLDNVKGDAARIVLYLYVHYNNAENVHGTTNGSGRSSYFGTLPLTNVIAASSEEEAIELLLQWNELDEVDEIERTRNEEAFKIQGNRNPFIDHPEYAEAIWNPPVDPEPVDPEPVEPEPVDPEPVDPEPVDPEPVDPEPVDPEPVDPEPVEPEPVDPKPVEPEKPSEEPSEGGCGGVIGGSAAAVFAAALAAAAAVLRRRK